MVFFLRLLRVLTRVSLVAFSAANVQNFVYYAAPLTALTAAVMLTREITTATIRYSS